MKITIDEINERNVPYQREMFKKMSEAKKTGKALKLAELLPGKF